MNRFFAGLLLFLLVASQQAIAAIAIDSTSSGRINGGSSLDISHTTSSGSDRFMLVGVSLWNSDDEVVTSVTYSGQSLTFVGAREQEDDSRVEIWKLVNPPVTTSNVQIRFDESVQNGAGAGVMTFTGVDQIAPHDVFQSNSGESGRITLTVTSETNDLVFAVAAAEEQDDAMSISLGDQRWNYKSNNKIAGAGATLAGTTSTNFRWNLGDSDDWAVGGISINPAGVSGPLPSPVLEYQFDQCSLGSGVTDNVGGYDGTANGSTETTNSEFQINRSLDLSEDGIADYVTLDSNAVDGLNAFSIATWIKTGEEKDQQEIFQALGSSANDDEIEIYLVDSNQVQMNVADRGDTVSAGTTLTDDNWHHIVVTRSGSTMCLYVDGRLANCHSSGGTSGISISNSSSVIIGQEQDEFGDDFDSDQAFEGYIDEFKIYSQVLSSSNVGELYRNELNGDNADGTSRSGVSCSGGGGFKWEGGSVDVSVGSPVTINFQQTYADPVVFLMVESGSADPTSARVVSTSSNSAQIVAVEPPDENQAGSETIKFLIAEKGVFELAGGVKIEVGEVDVSAVQHGSGVSGAETWQTINFSQSFSVAPVLLTQITSNNNGSLTTPWLTSAVTSLGSSSFQAALGRAEVGAGTVTVAESYAYLAVDEGALPDLISNATGLSVTGEAVSTGRAVSHNCRNITLLESYSSAPDYVATITSHYGGDGGWVRGCGSTTTSVRVKVDEDTYRDRDRSHTTEDVGIVVFGGSPSNLLPTALAEYRFDETVWEGTEGEVEDSSFDNNGSIVDILDGSDSSDHIQTIVNGKICRAADIEPNSEDDDQYAVDTGLDVDNAIGNAGTISLWYRSDTNWSAASGENLFNATSAGSDNKYFYLIRTSSGELQFGLEDSSDADFRLTTSPFTFFTSDNWVHITATWDTSDEYMAIYVNGVLAQGRDLSGTSGQLAGLLTLYIGDNRNEDYVVHAGVNSAAGHIDEVVIFNKELRPDQVSQLYTNQNNGRNYDGSTRGILNCGEFTWEGGSVEVDIGVTQTINFQQTFTNPVLFLVAQTQNPDPTAARVVSVGPSSAQIIAVEPPNQDQSGTEQVHYLVAERGAFTLAGGVKVEVNAIDLTAVQNGDGVSGTSSWEAISFVQDFTAPPALLTQITTNNNGPSLYTTPWVYSAANSLDADGFDAAIGRAEVSAGSVTLAETYAYLAVDEGALPGLINSDWGRVVTAEAIATGTVVTGDCYSANLTQTYSSEPDFVAAINSLFGSNGGWARGCDSTTTTVSVEIDEDTFGDTERSHTTEDVGIVVFDTLPNLPISAEWYFDEPSWAGSADEVADNIGSNDGTAQGGASTNYPGQVCRAGSFNSLDSEYVGGLDLSRLQTTASLSFWIKTSQTGNDTSWSAPGVTGVEQAGGADDIFWGWIDGSGRIGLTVADDYAASKSNTAINDDAWHHIVLTRDAATGGYQIFIDGRLDKRGTGGVGDIGNSFSSLGRIEDTGGTPVYFDGQLDEVIIFDEVLTETDVANIYANQLAENNWDGSPRGACVVGGADHYSISHALNGVTCLPEQITITAHDSGHNPVDAIERTITITTDSGVGDWNNIVSGGGTLVNGAANDGEATYTFANGSTSVVLEFSHTATGTFGFNVTDGSVTETSGSALASDDPSMTIAGAVLKFVDRVGNPVNIATQISGKDNSEVYLRGIEADVATPASCSSSFTGPQTIGFAATCENPNTCVSSQRFYVNGTEVDLLDSGSPLSYTGISIDFGADSISDSPVTLNYEDAGLMRLNMSLADPAMLGSSNNFIVRPFAFGFPSIVAGTENNTAGDETGGDGFTSAGSDFDVQLNAYRYESTDDSNNDNIPDAGADVTDNGITPNFTGTVTISSDSHTPAGGVLGNLTGTLAPLLDVYSNRSGADVTATLQYDEVGSVSIIAQMNDYLGDSGADIQSVVTKIGRFYPHYIVLSDVEVESSCSPAIYMQQPFSKVEYRLEARAADDAITENYDRDIYNTEDVGLAAEDSDDGNNLSVRLAAPAASLLSDWEAGVVDRTSISASGAITDLTFIRSGGAAGFEDGPFEQLQLGIYIDQGTGLGDGVNFDSGALNYDPDTAGSCGSSCAGIQIGGSFEARYGRLFAQSAHGPENAILSVPFFVQYWDGVNFVTSDDDTCSAIPLSGISFDGNSIDVAANRTVTLGGGTTTGTLNISGTSALPVSGNYGLEFSAPGAGNMGYFNLGINSVPEWLRYDWDQNGTANDSSMPTSLITFGRARGNDRMIFWQERYQ